MKTEEAQFILGACRAGDEHDPQFAEALALAEKDPALRAWLAETRALDAAISHKLAQTAVPAHLKASILAGARIIKVTPWYRRPQALALAASVVFAAVLSMFFLSRPAPLSAAAFRQEAVKQVAAYGPHVDFINPKLPNVEEWLKDHGGPALAALPESMNKVGLAGCRVLQWQGRKVTMVCYHGGDGRHFDLFVIDGAPLPGTPQSGERLFAKAGSLSTATWTQNGHTYLMTSEMDDAALRHLLEG